MTSPPRPRHWSPGMPSIMESATCFRPAAGMPGMVTQHILLLFCHCPCYLSPLLICCLFVPPPLVLIQFFSNLHSSPGFTFDLLLYSFLCTCSHHLRCCLFACLLLWALLALFIQSCHSPLFPLACLSSCLSFCILFSQFSSFFSELICSYFLTGLDLSCFCSSLFSIPFCSILKLFSVLASHSFLSLVMEVDLFNFFSLLFIFLQYADVRDARKEGPLWCNWSGSLR